MERHSQEHRTLIHTGREGGEGSRCGGIAQVRDRSAANAIGRVEEEGNILQGR